MPEQGKNFDNEFRQRLFDRFEKRSRTFSVTYRTTIIFTFAFLAIVLVPLVALEYDDHRIRTKETDWKLKKELVENLRLRIAAINDRLPVISAEHSQTQQAMLNKENELAEIEDRTEHIEQQIEKNTKNLNLYLGKAKAFAQIEQRFYELRAYDPRASAQELIDAFAQIVNHGGRIPSSGPCASSDVYQFVKCKVKTSLQAHLIAYKQVIADADQLLSQYEDLKGMQQIDAKISDVMKALDRLFEENPDFWNTIRGKIFFFGEFKAPMNAALGEAKHQMNRYGEVLKQQKDKINADFTRLETKGEQLGRDKAQIIQSQNELRDELEAKEREIQALKSEDQSLKEELTQRQAEYEVANRQFEKLDREKKEIVKSKAEIEARLEKVQSPFGTIPVRLKEALLIFPVIVAVGVIMYSLILMELFRLRKTFHRDTHRLYGENRRQVGRQVAMIAPLWVDPLGSMRSNIGGSFLLALPALAYFLALLLIVYSWYLAGIQHGSTPIIQGIYIFLYVLGAIGFIICAGLIVKEWKQYAKAENTKKTESGLDQ